jgi:Ca-activated chloride channel family protein
MAVLKINLKKSLNAALSLMAIISMSNNALSVPVLAAKNNPRSLALVNVAEQQDKKVTFSGEEGSGTLLAMMGAKHLGQCPLKHTDVKASVSGYVARVSVKQVFENKFDKKIEAIYTFPLPENAAVDEMTMRIGERVIKGKIKKRDEAREIYEQAKAAGHVASLLDQERPNIFTQSVANIEPGAKVEIEIKYVDTLPYEEGAYTFNFPTVVGPRFIPGNPVGQSGRGRLPDTDLVPDASRITPKVAAKGERAGHDISISLDIDAGVPIHSIASQLHEVKSNQQGTHAHVELANKETIPNKDFVLKWEVAGEKIQSGCLTHRDDKSGFFSLMLMPPKKVQPEEVSPKEMVFLVDCSGSQNGAPLEKAKETLSYIVDHMNSNDTFQVVAFSSGQKEFSERPQIASPEMKRKAKDFISHLYANGGTWMAPAVEKVCSMPNDDHRLRIVTFMTDGYVGNDMEIMGMIKKYRGKSRWFSFGTGNSVNRFLIDGIAREGGGEADYVLLNSPGETVGKKFYDRISTPLLTDVKVDYHDLEVKDIYPHELADVWAQKPLYIKGRYLKPGAGTITLTGYAGGKPYKQDLKVVFPEKQTANEVIKPMWARAKVDRLMSEDWYGAQQGKINKELQDEIVKTALDYHIMTQYTSFVAVEEKRVTKSAESHTVDVPVEMPDGVSREETLSDERPIVHDYRSMPSAGMNKTLQAYGGGGGAGGMALPTVRRAGNSWSSGPIAIAPSVVHSCGGRGYATPTEFSASSLPSPPLPTPKPSLAPTTTAQQKPKAEAQAHPKEAEKKASSSSKMDETLSNLLNSLKSNKNAKVSGVQLSDGKVLIKLTLTDLSASTLQKLKALGLETVITSQNDHSVIARITVEKLEELSRLVEVTKIEPARSSK